MSRERVLVTEYVEGIGFEQVRELPQEERDRFGEIIFRFFFGCLYRTLLFSGDPGAPIDSWSWLAIAAGIGRRTYASVGPVLRSRHSSRSMSLGSSGDLA